MEALMELDFFGRPFSTWLIALAIAVGSGVLAFLVRWFTVSVVREKTRRSDRDTAAADTSASSNAEAPPEADGLTGNPTEDLRSHFAVRLVKGFITPALVLGGLWIAVSTLEPTTEAGKIINSVLVVVFSLVGVRFLVLLIDEFFRRVSQDSTGIPISRMKPLRAIAVVVIWLAGLLFLLDNLGMDVTAIVAGLGIGGIAAALAAQALLGDLFSYFVILLDKPFELGDFLIFGDVLGTVDKIGVKNTRIRSLGGELIIVPNHDLTSNRIRNYRHMERRRVVFRVGVVYGTLPEHLREIPQSIREIIEREQMTTFDRAHFASYGEWSLAFEVVYYVLSPDYNLYMDIQQRINLALYDVFAERGITFALPTRTVNLNGTAQGRDG